MQGLRNIGGRDGVTDAEAALIVRLNRGLISQIAKRHGVSVSTVSRALWGKQAAPQGVIRALRAALRRERRKLCSMNQA